MKLTTSEKNIAAAIGAIVIIGYLRTRSTGTCTTCGGGTTTPPVVDNTGRPDILNNNGIPTTPTTPGIFESNNGIFI